MESEIKKSVADLCPSLISSMLVVLITLLLWRAMDLLWIKPKRTERFLREQGLKGNSYKLVIGDALGLLKSKRKPVSQPGLDFSDATLPGVTAFFKDNVEKHGEICFMWIGPSPCFITTNPELIKEILTKYDDFQKPNTPFDRLLLVGLFGLEGETWSKHRKIINPAFHLDKLKNMLDAMYISCYRMTSVWEGKISEKGSTELDVWPSIESLTCDVIARAAFGSSYDEGRRIFDLLKEHVCLVMQTQAVASNYIPGWRFLPTKVNRRLKELYKEVDALLTALVESRKRELEATGCTKDDLLGILLESNMREIKEHGNEKGRGLTTQDVVQECKLFYLAGQETTSSLLIWALILLSKHQIWQERARAEILQVFGKDGKPDFKGISRLKVVTMILYEVLRLYSPVYTIARKVFKETKLKNWRIPKGMQLLLPTSVVHQNDDLWGKDANLFNPERFSEGVSKATNRQGAFLPFSNGPRICIGQNFALLEAKLALTMILQLFTLDFSPSYMHAPTDSFTMKPRYGAKLVLRKL